MLAVIRCTNQGEPALGLQRETEDIIDGSVDDFNFIEDLQANDWFLEDQPASEEASQPPEPLVEATNWLVAELGTLDAGRLQQVTGILQGFMGAIRELQRRGENRMTQCQVTVGTGCHSCAFNPATDGLPGFAATAYGLVRTFRLTAPFMCHRSQSGPERVTNTVRRSTLEHCVGFATVFITHPVEAKDLAMRATTLIQAVVPEANMKMPPE